MDGKDLITSKQMAILTFVGQTGIGITMLPTYIAREIGHDGWISAVVTGLLAIILSTVIVLLLRRYSDKAIYDINKLLYGKIIGTVFNISIFIYLLCTTAAGIRTFVLFLRITLFPTTPPLILSVFILLPSIYMVYKGLKTVVRFKYMTLVTYFIALLYVVLVLKEARYTFLLPVGEAGIFPIIKSIPTSFFAYLGLELIVIFYPSITDKENALKWHVNANIASMLFVAIIVAICTAVFGDKLLSTQTIPFFNLSRVYNAPILERVDLYIVATWFVAMGCSIRAYMMAAFYVVEKGFKIKKNKPIYLVFITLIIIISRIPKDINKSLDFLEIINYAGISVTGFLIVCLIISFFNKKGVVENEAKN